MLQRSENRRAASFPLPPTGGSPGSDSSATTPGSFANPAQIAPGCRGALTYSSPDTPGMPAPSTKTAWDFLPEGWTTWQDDGAAPAGTIDARTDPNDLSRAGTIDARTDPNGPPPAGTIDARTDPNDPAVEILRFVQGDGTTRAVRVPAGFAPLTQLEHARLGRVTPQMRRVAEREGHLTPEQVRDEVAAGRLVIPANRIALGYRLDPMGIGRALRTKINANLGASPVSSGTDEEVAKMEWAVRWGADTVMDLSTGGDLDACRDAICRASTVPVGTVPIYAMILGRKIETLDEAIVLETLEAQAKQGVSYFTIHAGVLREDLDLARHRMIGLVSRGGSLLAKWMLHHDRQNLMYTAWERICEILRQYDVTFSIGDGCRPGGLADATDRLQIRELETLGELTERAWRMGCQVMIEGPGHVPFDQIEYNAKLQRRLCHGAPFYVLGPLVTDVFPGYDHITSAIGATAMAFHGAAMLCYVTPKEHLGLPKKDDVKQGCVAYKIAAHAADVALGIPGARDWDDALTRARAALNWERHFELSFDPDTARALHDEDLDVDTDFCAMCGHDWCSVRISREITEWASGKAEDAAWEHARVSAALTPEQRETLEKRGVLDPAEIHRLASKTRRAMSPDGGGAGDRRSEAPAGGEAGNGSRMPETTERVAAPACHSDQVSDEDARRMQEARLRAAADGSPAQR